MLRQSNENVDYSSEVKIHQ